MYWSSLTRLTTRSEKLHFCSQPHLCAITDAAGRLSRSMLIDMVQLLALPRLSMYIAHSPSGWYRGLRFPMTATTEDFPPLEAGDEEADFAKTRSGMSPSLMTLPCTMYTICTPSFRSDYGSQPSFPDPFKVGERAGYSTTYVFLFRTGAFAYSYKIHAVNYTHINRYQAMYGSFAVILRV